MSQHYSVLESQLRIASDEKATVLAALIDLGAG
jgi:hypothetical protein